MDYLASYVIYYDFGYLFLDKAQVVIASHDLSFESHDDLVGYSLF